MSTAPSTSVSHSNFVSIFNAALGTYVRKTKKDLASHPLLPRLQSCKSPEAVLAVLREQIPVFSKSRNGDDGLTKWVTPTVNVLYTFSTTVGGSIGQAFPLASIIFAGIGVLLLAVKDAGAIHNKLFDLFNRIERFFRRLEIYTGIPPTAAMTDMIIEIMVEVLDVLAIATKEAKRGRLKRYIKKLTGNTDIDDSLERLDKLTQEEARMASAELLKITHNVGSRVDQVSRNQLRDSLLLWLSPPDPSINHNIASKAHYDGTAQWFFQGSIFNQWKYTGPFLWIHGKPGSGKSVLCSSIIQDIIALRENGRASMAYFYFDFRDVDKQKLHNLLQSLLIQLSAQSDPCCDILSKLYSSHARGVRRPSDRAMVECLKEMLTLGAEGPTYIIMDALDECPMTSVIPSPREEVLEFVDELVGLRLPNVHICVTSRPEHDIQAVLERLTLCPVSLHDESGQQQDIANYVASFVHSDRRMRRWREEDMDLVIKTLPEKADGMFRWAFCQLEVLRHCFPCSVRQLLEELPESLDETYERILREIRKSNQGHAHRLLQCLVAAARPLRVRELAEVLAFDFSAEGVPSLNPSWRWDDQKEAVMSACSSLVVIVKAGDAQIVQFSHFSVKEFLTADRLAEPIRDVSYYHIRLEAAHTILARACLGALLQLDERVESSNIESFPLARYAAQYWAAHARFENASSSIKDGMKVLFDANRPHFTTWLWVYNEDRDGRSMTTMCPLRPEAVPLYYAAMLGFRDLAEHLICEHPEDVYANGGREVTSMHVAARAGHANILSLLLEHGADVDCRGIDRQTPLHRASLNAKGEAGKCLLDRGTDIEAGNNRNQTPLFHAVFYGHVEFARMLLERGARVNAHDNRLGRTALHWAVGKRNFQAVRLLLEHGADINAPDKLGRTPSQLGSELNALEIVELLSEYSSRTEKVVSTC